MAFPLIDILIPTYEADPVHLRAAIESAIAQTETRWRLLVNDDHSESNVRSSVEPFMRDSRVFFLKNNRRYGIGGNWNLSLEKGEAEYVQFLFQDDVWEPTYLEKMLAALQAHPTAGFAAADHTYDCSESTANAYKYQEVRAIRNEILQNGLQSGQELLHTWIKRQLHPNLIGEPSFVMLRQSLIRQIGFFAEDLPQFLDVEYWLRALSKSDIVYVKENLGSFRVHPKGASAQNEESGAGIYDRLLCFDKLILTLPWFGKTMRIAKKARKDALVVMIRKFFERRKNKQKTPMSGNGKKMKMFALNHPLLVTGALLKALIK
ncbi:glycosyltransferase [Candidatus Peribacteria bacterium]|nr:MAG: glycosyltransferase [Candidatus Peribacteria bacterium]